MRLLRSATLALALGLGWLPFAPEPGRAATVVSITVAPPPLPVYAQPPIPAPGYLWIPGYWAWDGDDYYWVPGYWERPPRVGLLWTPGYWAWNNGIYVYRTGYWGRTVGFYGGVNYGYGYTGIGYAGGYWRGRTLYYNRSVTNININITNVYERPVTVRPGPRVSYNGGQGGLGDRPSPQQISAASHGLPPTLAQRQHVQSAATNPAMRSRANHGMPAVGAIATPPSGAPKMGVAPGPKAGPQPGAGFVGQPGAKVGGGDPRHPGMAARPAPGGGVAQPVSKRPAIGAPHQPMTHEPRPVRTPQAVHRPPAVQHQPQMIHRQPQAVHRQPQMVRQPQAARPMHQPAAHPGGNLHRPPQ